MTTPVCSCSRPIRDSAFLCQDCTRTLEKQLAEIPALAADLDTTLTRTSRTGGRSIGIVVHGGERPVPWDDRAARVAHALVRHLARWTRTVTEHAAVAGPVCARRCPHPSCTRARLRRPARDTTPALAAYLLAALPTLRHLPQVTDLADETSALRDRIDTVIDRPADLTFFGPCGAIDYWPGTDEPVLCSARCTGDLYGAEDAAELTCGTCGAEHDVTTVRKFLLKEAEDQLVTAADLSKFLTAYGEPLTAERIRQWASRGLLLAHGKDRAGRPLYRVREAVDRLTQIQATRRRAQSA